MSTKSASACVVRQSAEDINTSGLDEGKTLIRRIVKPPRKERNELTGNPPVKTVRKNLMYTSWQPRKTSPKPVKNDGGAMSINEARLRSYLLDTRGLSSKNVTSIMRNICTIQRVWGISEPTEENALILKSAMRGKGRTANAIRQYMWA
jgi:hypothetical protein